MERLRDVSWILHTASAPDCGSNGSNGNEGKAASFSTRTEIVNSILRNGNEGGRFDL
jgi:hypothetical protein